MTVDTSIIRKQENRICVEARMSASNETLSENDSSVVRELITEVVEELGSVDEDISRLEKVLSNLQIRRQGLHSRLERLRSGAHRKLPSELLAYIFRYCQNEAIHLPPQYTQDIWSITQVCSKWRAAAIADPQLWSRLNVQTPNKLDPRLIHLVDDIFQNRGGEGKVSYMTYINHKREWEQALDLTCTYRSRIRNLEIHFDCILDLDAFKLETSCGPDNPLFHPNIRPTSPWTHLTDICIFRITIPMLLVILNQSTQLVTCRVMVTESRSIRDNGEYPIMLEHLQTLDVMQEQCSGVDGFLARLLVPKLKVFRTGCLQDWPQSGIMKMLEQSNCPLKIFETTYHVPPTVLPVLMSAMPEVTTLKIYPVYPIPENILNEIREKNLSPKLRRLRGWEIQSLRPFVDLLQSRWKSPGEGICDAIVRIRYKNFIADEEYFRGLLPELTKNDRQILLNAY